MPDAFLSAQQVTQTEGAAGVILDALKLAMRISGTAFDVELNDLVSAAQADLELSGVVPDKAADLEDPLIKRAVITYVKAHFGWDNPDAERLANAYDLLKAHLTLSREYSMYTVTFTVTDGALPVEDATVTLGAESLDTDSSGQAVFYVQPQQNLAYTVTRDGYKTVSGEVDVTSATTVAVTLEVA